MAPAHHGHAHGGARARGGRAHARARRAALGAGRGHLWRRATLSNTPVVTWLWPARALLSMCSKAILAYDRPAREATMWQM